MVNSKFRVDEYLNEQVDSPHLSPRLIIDRPILPSLSVWVNSDGKGGRIQRWYDLTLDVINEVGIRSIDYLPDGVVKLLDKNNIEIYSKTIKLTDDLDGLPLLLARIEKLWSLTQSSSEFWSKSCEIIFRSEVPKIEEIRKDIFIIKRTIWIEIVCFWIAFLAKVRFESGQSEWEELISGDKLIFKYGDFYNESPHRGPALREPLYESDRVRLKALLESVGKAQSNNEKKETLETLTEVLLKGVEGFQILPSIRTATGEIDRIIRNHVNHPVFSILGSHILVECKNWDSTIGTDQLGSFIIDIQDAGLKAGFFFCKKIISKAAKQRITNAYQRSKIFIIIITKNEINSICDGGNFSQLLVDKIEAIMFQR